MEPKMILTVKDWQRIRENFSELEKDILNDAITSAEVDEGKAGEVANKIKTMLSAITEKESRHGHTSKS
jgi:hypothetical protein